MHIPKVAPAETSDKRDSQTTSNINSVADFGKNVYNTPNNRDLKFSTAKQIYSLKNESNILSDVGVTSSSNLSIQTPGNICFTPTVKTDRYLVSPQVQKIKEQFFKRPSISVANQSKCPRDIKKIYFLKIFLCYA